MSVSTDARARPVATLEGSPVWTPAFVVAELEDAGRTLLALPHSGYSTLCRTSSLSYAREVYEAYGWQPAEARPSPPSGEAIDQMELAYGWLPCISERVVRRIVGARSLVHPIRDRHLHSWRAIGRRIGADHHAVQRWHAQGIAQIVVSLNHGTDQTR